MNRKNWVGFFALLFAACSAPMTPSEGGGTDASLEEAGAGGECRTTADCGRNQVCTAGRCAQGTTCTSSRQCPGQVCGTTFGVCVDCNENIDCTNGMQCRGGSCVPPPMMCVSSRQCSTLGQVCDMTLGICVDCAGDNDCERGKLCSPEHTCRVPVCTPSRMECVNPSMARRCDARGAAWETVACSATQTCSEGMCRERVCVPGTATCASFALRSVCNSDGLAATPVPCATTESCMNGMCVPRVCNPGAMDCNGTMVRQCNMDGLGYTSSACGGAHAMGQCTTGQCVLTCDAGYADCNRMIADGCESSVSADRNNCGSCGNVCPTGQSCVSGSCQAISPVDVLVLLDATGSVRDQLRVATPALLSNLVTPLLALSEVHVGVAYTAEFPVSPYGSAGDVPFRGALEPSRDMAMIQTALSTVPMQSGGDTEDAMVEALGTLSGLPIHPRSVAMTCSAGRVAGGCWRPGARRVVVLFTNSSFHNGPLASCAGLRAMYTGITPAPVEWPAVLSAMQTSNTLLLFMSAVSASTPGDTQAQWQRMLMDLGQPSTDVYDTAQGAATATAANAVLQRVRVLRGG